MKNNTKIRLHLSKKLFESLAKQVLAEGKKGDMSGGAYTEAVKQSKGEKKSEKNEDLNISKNEVPQVRKTGAGDPKAPKGTTGASKQQVATDLRKKGTELMSRVDANIQSGEGGAFLDIITRLLDIADDKDNAAPAFNRIKTVLDTVEKGRKSKGELNISKNDVPQIRKIGEMETNVAEDETMDEADHVVRGAEMAGKDLMGAISSGDPALVGAALVLLVTAGVLSADKVAKTLKGYYQALVKKDPAQAEDLADKAEEANIDIK